MNYTILDEEITAINTPPKNILIAEDDIINVFILERILHPLNFNVVVAENGLEAVEKFKEFEFDIVLMDLYMPIMNGFEASKQIRSLSAKVPIIVISAASLDIQKLQDETGISHFLSKPIEIYRLKLLLNQVLKVIVSESHFK